MRSAAPAAFALALSLPLVARGEPAATYGDAADPATEQAAEAAVARLGPKRALDLRPTLLAISGLSSSIVASVQEVRQAMRDLGAREIGLEVHVELPADVLFDFDQADLRPDAREALGKLAVIIRSYPSARVRVDGYTDSKGDDRYNLALSTRRAASVVRWLREREGLGETEFETRGLGESNPLAPNARPDGTDDPAGRQKNRRVEIVVTKG